MISLLDYHPKNPRNQQLFTITWKYYKRKNIQNMRWNQIYMKKKIQNTYRKTYLKQNLGVDT